MFVCYAIGATCAAAGILGGVVGILFWSNLTASSNTLLDLVGSTVDSCSAIPREWTGAARTDLSS